jgi:hypothetical protein
VRVSEILSRLTGISTPLGGVSWKPATPDVEVARSALIFLEDRRVLYNPTQIEFGPYCVQSVLEIRQFLTDVLSKQGIGDALAEHLRVMRAACGGFLDRYHDYGEYPGMIIFQKKMRSPSSIGN